MKKKLAVFACVASLTAASLTTPAYAASSFSEILSSQIQESLDKLEGTEIKMPAGFSANIKLTAEDTAKALLGMLAPVDLSWLDSVSIGMEGGAQDKVFNGTLAVNVNDTPIISVKALVDQEAEGVWLQAPELSADCLTISFDELTAMAESGSAGLDDETKQLIQLISSNLAGYSYDTDTIIQLVKDFYDIMFKAYVDDGSEEDTITAGGVSQDVTRIDAHMDGDSTLAMMEELFIFVRDSEEIQNIYTAAVEGVEDAPSWGDIQTVIDEELLPEFTSVEEEIPVYSAMSVWVGEDDEFVGSQSHITSDDQNMSILVLTPKDGDNCGFSLTAGDGETDLFTIEGAGQTEGSLLSGHYGINVQGTEFATIDVTDYDVEAARQGFVNGTYDVALTIPEDFQGGSLSMLNNFGLNAKVASDKSGYNADLTVTTGGTAMATLSVSGSLLDAAPEGLDPALTEGAISLTEGMENYLAGIDFSAPIETLTSIGMPEEFIEHAASLLG